ncbi:MAG: hypothetical protein RML40_00075 [Bacteroidota bacterium]|nr:hypothetical protein [Candidatus Kapabacteria bacterium]MDW8218902.1 hypothetical protein [Bacteroidota bacterium]
MTPCPLVRVVILTLISCHVMLYAQDSHQSVSSLKQYIGQMPADLLKQEPKIQERLQKLLGKDYQRLEERFAYGVPIEMFGDVLILRGEKPYMPGNPKAVVGIGLFTNKIHCALVEKNGRDIYSEDPKRIPNEFNKFIIINDKRAQEEAEKRKKAELENADKK